MTYEYVCPSWIIMIKTDMEIFSYLLFRHHHLIGFDFKKLLDRSIQFDSIRSWQDSILKFKLFTIGLVIIIINRGWKIIQIERIFSIHLLKINNFLSTETMTHSISIRSDRYSLCMFVLYVHHFCLIYL